MKLFESEKYCCGCAACVAVCPQNIINFIQNKEGFWFPQILDSKLCVHCDLCHMVCPMHHGTYHNKYKNYYAAITKDYKIWENSSSGGIFYSIGFYVIECLDGIVFGAKWNGLDVELDYADSVDKLRTFCKSKYVTSIPGDAYQQAKCFLDGDRYVLFSGTPCQINGLKNYLKKDYDKLITVDFACHGQGSAVVFKRWITYLENKYKRKIKHFEFREKRMLKDHVNSNCCSYTFDNGRKEYATRDYYYHAYINGLCMRKSCETCKFSGNRASDITLADFKNQTRVIPFKMENRNISTIITQTDKGDRVISRINSLVFYEADIQYIERYNPKLFKSLAGNHDRDKFMKEVTDDHKPIDKIIKKYIRILPTELLEYNVSSNWYKKLYPLCRILDYIYLFSKRIRGMSIKEQR